MHLQSYISGYCDGEGCFCVSFSPSKRHRFGWEIRPSFSVSQNADRSELLFEIQRLWDCGSIRPDRSDHTLKFEVRRIDDLMQAVIPHFEAFPLRSSKQNDFEKFGQICRIVLAKGHLTIVGFHQVVDLAFLMNVSGKRKFSRDEVLTRCEKVNV